MAIEVITGEHYNTDPDNIEVEELIVTQGVHYMPKRTTYHCRSDFFCSKQEKSEAPKEHWKKVVELEKNCDIKDIKQENLLFSKFISSNTDKKLPDKLVREKKLDIKLTSYQLTLSSKAEKYPCKH